MWTLLHQKQWLRGGMLILNAVVQTQMMLNTQVAQIRHCAIDYLAKGITINSEYYIALLVHLKEEITKKRPQIKCHKSIAMMAKLHELHFKLLPRPSYDPDLAPSDYWQFADLKECSRKRDLAPMNK